LASGLRRRRRREQHLDRRARARTSTTGLDLDALEHAVVIARLAATLPTTEAGRGKLAAEPAGQRTSSPTSTFA